MRISDWSSDVCSSDLGPGRPEPLHLRRDFSGGKYARGPQIGQLRPACVGITHPVMGPRLRIARDHVEIERKSVVSGKSVSVRVHLGGRSNVKNKKLHS